MSLKRWNQVLIIIATTTFLAFCSKGDKKNDVTSQLSISSVEELFTSDGGASEVTVTSNTQWNISNTASWCAATASSTNGNGKISLNVQSNSASTERSVTISVNAGSMSKQFNVRQLGKPISDSIPADQSGMSSNAVQLAARIKLGLNIGNTLEAIGGETAWGNPKVTKEFIDFVRQSGFNAIRIPCSWDQYVQNPTTNQIKGDWLSRVKEVVQYCVDDSLYVILNIHWDGGWLDNNINAQAQASVKNKQYEFWKQIATTLRDFNEHLMFASANEPPVDNATQMSILLSYHQTFINAVRSTGGRNSYRVLVVQAPSTDIDKAETLMNTLPADPIPDRMMAEVHYYSPFQFCALAEDASWGNMFYYWGQNNHSTIEPARNATWAEEDYVVAEFQKMKTKFTDKGIPVILGEYGAYRRTTPLDMEKHQASIDHWATFVTQQAIANGLKPFWWDTGSLLSRSNYTVLDQRTLTALIQGVQ